jgi:small conductance mechanosensitive channel
MPENLLQIYVIPWGLKIFFAIAIYVIGRIVAKLIVKILNKLMTRAKIEETLRQFLASIASAVLMVFIIFAVLDQLGVNTNSVLAIFAAAGLAVGLAFKDSLSNFAAGIMIIMFKPFRLGNFIDAAGVSGTVEEIRIFSTIMRTGDNKEIIIPNGKIYSGIITNFSAKPTRRIDLVIGIGYEDNIGVAKKLIEDIIASESRILTDPAPTIMVLELGESSINIAVRPWVKSEDYWSVRAELLQAIKETFDKEGISIPYPQREIHMNQVSA